MSMSGGFSPFSLDEQRTIRVGFAVDRALGDMFRSPTALVGEVVVAAKTARRGPDALQRQGPVCVQRSLKEGIKCTKFIRICLKTLP